MSGWINIGPGWNTETTYRIRELLQENGIPIRMPFDEAFFQSMYHLPHKDRYWEIKVRRKDLACTMALLQKEGFIYGCVQQLNRSERHDRNRMPASAMLNRHDNQNQNRNLNRRTAWKEILRIKAFSK